MKLTKYEQEMLDGEHGEMRQKALQVLCDLGEYEGAEEFVEVTLCHSDNAVYMGEAAAAFVEYLGDSGVKLAVPTTTNACSLDMDKWAEQGFEPKIADAIRRMEAAHAKMGAIPTWTCAPYQSCVQPVFGQQIVSAESNVICYYNSVIGARTNRYAGPLELLGGIAGRVPYFGLHVKENRYAEGLVKLSDEIKPEWFNDDSLYALIAYAYGSIVGNRVWAIEGMPKRFRKESLRDFSATAASSGGIALYHMVGVTPEAQTVDMAFNGKRPKEVEEINLKSLCDAEKQLNNPEVKNVDMILLGCPHFSYDDCQQVLRLLDGRRVSENIEVNITVGRDTADRMMDDGIYNELLLSGIKVYKEGCALEIRAKKRGIKTLMSNSGKFGTYSFGLTGIQPVFGSLSECIETAVSGELVREDKPWRE
ncbi:MAG: aconitase X catalytic domain-containing protein [Eubacteriaceae bacterium]|jgi:predicted aconitase|nr:aconitase X catalytic domain-containing protein [Eubacteriaceae bacterium]